MCTVAVWADNGVVNVSARNMDWLDYEMDTKLWVLPRGMKRVGLDKPGENSLDWESKYGSIVAVAYNIASADGVNEKSLAMHLLWLAGSDYGQRDQNIPGMSVSLWGQFILDNFATVAEAVDYMRDHPLQLQPVLVSKHKLSAALHMQIEDASGDVAVFEYVDGKLNTHHGKQYPVMTNEPAFQQQLDNLKQYTGFGGSKPIPGTSEPEDRFVRTEYYLRELQKPKNSLMAIASIVSVLRNAAQPFGSINPQAPNTAATLWRTVVDHTNKGYYFESSTSPFMVWVDITKLDFSEDAPVLCLDVLRDKPLAGEVNQYFQPAKPFTWAMPE